VQILLLGGAGAQGTVMIPELAAMPEVKRLVCADLNMKTAQRLAETFDKVEAEPIDATDLNSVADAAADADIIINLLSPRFNLQVMKIAADAGTHYQDLAGIIDVVAMASKIGEDWRKISQTGMQPAGLRIDDFIDFGDRFEKAGVNALIHTGSAPGLVNVLARECADRMDTVETIRIRNYSNIQTRRFVLFWWAPKVAWNDMVSRPLLYENGEFKTIPPFAGWEDYQFPNLIGKRSLSHHLHEEVATLPRLIGKGIRYVDFKYGGPHAEIAALALKLGWLGESPIQVKDQHVIPRDVLFAITPDPPTVAEIKAMVAEGIGLEEKALAVDVSGFCGKKPVRWVATVKAPGFAEAAARCEHANPVSYVTGLSAAAFTKLLIGKHLRQKGMIAPEQLDARARSLFYDELASKGITAEIQAG
jgi:lysine 6-dehydrogenase